MTEIIHRYAAIAGRALEEETGKPVPGAQVRIVSAPRDFRPVRGQAGVNAGRSDCTSAGTDGHFHFMDLPNGSYELRVTSKDTLPRDISVVVTRTGDGPQPPQTADVTLTLTTPPAAGPVKAVKLMKPARLPKDGKR